jgi:hypothetical protein
MPFTGFHVKLPEYEVITPQTKLSFTLRSLTVQEEENLKGSLLTPNRVADHLNKSIFDCIVKKPESIKDYDTFLRNVTIKDREALLYGLYHITYEDIRNFEVTCASCEKLFPIKVNISDSFNFLEYPGNDVLTKRVKVDMVKTKGVSAIVKQPTLFDEIVALKSLSGRPNASLEALSETLIIEKFMQDMEASVTPIEYVDKEDIIDAYLSLPPKDKRLIFNEYREQFGKYAIDLKIQHNCPKCDVSSLYAIDLVGNFFRELQSI